MVFTVVVVVSLSVTGLIGGKGSRAEQDELLQEIEDEYRIATSSRDLERPPQRDLRLGSCDRLPDGTVRVNGSVTNYTETTARYELTAVVREGSGDDQGAELARTVVSVTDVPSEDTVPWSTAWEIRPSGSVTCKVIRIERYEQ